MAETSELIKALAKALPLVEGATKDKANPQFKGTKYADLASVIEAIRPVTKHGIWFRQAPVEHSSGACIETFYVHESGEQMSAGQCYVPASKNDAQGFGSAMTYCRRYGLLAAFGIAPEDDDGNSASASAPPQRPIADINQPASQVDLDRIADLAKAADVTLEVIAQSYLKDNIAQLDSNQAQAAIKRLKKTIDERSKS